MIYDGIGVRYKETDIKVFLYLMNQKAYIPSEPISDY